MNNIEYINLEQIGEQCGVKGGAILSYIKYCICYNIEIPAPVPYAKNKFPQFGTKYVYTKEDGLKIASMFKNKSRGEMAEYNYKNNWGKSYRENHKKSKHNN